jgi:hypothetical protein
MLQHIHNMHTARDADEVERERADAVADECAFTNIYMCVVAPRPLGQSPCLRNSFMVAGNHGFVIVHIRYTAQREICITGIARESSAYIHTQ